MKIPSIRSERSAIITALLFPVLLEIGLYFNVIWYVQIFNILLMLILYALFGVLFRRIRPSMICLTILMLALSIGNEFSINARSVAFQISDFFCIADALRLSGRYQFIVTWGMVRAAVIGVGLLTIALVLLRGYDDSRYRRRKFYSSAAAFCLALPLSTFTGIENYCDGDIKFDINTFTQENGVLYSLFVELKQHVIDTPANYSQEQAKETLDWDGTASTENMPNIIVVMNESLTDYDLVGELPLTEDILPFYHSMEENCIKGRAYSSVFGGYTCNSEWEFLTGHTMAFLPVTNVPYNQYFETETQSLASSLKEAGYATCAIHPYYGVEWNRDVNYPLMGFETFVTGPDFGDASGEVPEGMEEDLYFGDLEYIRGFISDAENYRKVIEVMEEKESGKPQFIFNITIQNHGSYGYEGDDFESEALCTGAEEPINQYLTVAHESDKAFEELIAYFETYPEDTIILMFGDHQPALDMPYTQLYADPDNPVAVREANYTVPYVMWANYDVEWEAQEDISLNYLSALLKQNAGLALDQWDTFRLDAMQQYPVLNSYGVMDSTGTFRSFPETLEESPLLQEYECLQYYRVFDAAE